MATCDPGDQKPTFYDFAVKRNARLGSQLAAARIDLARAKNAIRVYQVLALLGFTLMVYALVMNYNVPTCS